MCDHTRTIVVSSKANDCQVVRVPHLDLERRGYAPYISNLCGGDWVEFTVCLDCYEVLDLPDLTDEDLINAI